MYNIKNKRFYFSSSINQENKSSKKMSFYMNEKLVDRKRLLEEIRTVVLNSDERMKAIEVCEHILVLQIKFF
jgi:hypothetical protein